MIFLEMIAAFSRWFCIVVTIHFSGIGCDENEFRLTRYLMSNYDAAVRPVKNSSYVLSVVFGLALHHVMDVDEKNQIITTNCWITQKWNDSHLTWNYSDFGDIKVIRLPFNHVWKPDIILYNNADSQYSSATINTNVIVTYEGETTWLSHGIYKSTCDMNVQYFPFDVQECSMKWASWTYDGHQLDILNQFETGDLSNYHSNGEFDLVEFIVKKSVVYYSCCSEPYPDLTFRITLRRRPLFYVFNLILPCVLINIIALLVFYVPCESGEKVTLGISSILSMTVFLMTVRESLPPTEQTPLISMYYGVTICLVSMATALAVVTLNIHHRGGKNVEVPTLIKKLVLGFFSKLVFVECTPNRSVEKNDITEKHETPTVSDFVLRSAQKYHHEPGYGKSQTMPGKKVNHVTFSLDSTGRPSTDGFEQQFLRVLTRVYTSIEKNEIRVTDQEHRESSRSEWQQVALVCDRILLALFALSSVVATLGILLSSPYRTEKS